MILDILDGKTTAWANHPAVRQWNWHKEALLCYVDSIAKECKNRGFSDQNFKIDFDFEGVAKPWWLGHEPYHSSHRSKLLWKGRVDSICYSLRDYLGVRSINNWLAENNYSQKNLLKRAELEKLEEKLNTFHGNSSIKIRGNWYKQFNWVEDDTQPYFWPSKQNNS